MDDARVGAAFRSLRLRRGSRQSISDIELGLIGATSIDNLRRVAKALEMRVEVIARWRGGELDRLLNARHATVASPVAGYGQEMSAWLRSPNGRISALTFFSNTAGGGAMSETAARKRVRAGRRALLEREISSQAR